MERFFKIIIGLILGGVVGWLGVKCFTWMPGAGGSILGTILCILAIYIIGKFAASE